LAIQVHQILDQPDLALEALARRREGSDDSATVEVLQVQLDEQAIQAHQIQDQLARLQLE
jgi:hypothetical protein